MDFFQYKDGEDFLKRTGFTHQEAVEYLDKELQRRKTLEAKRRGLL